MLLAIPYYVPGHADSNILQGRSENGKKYFVGCSNWQSTKCMDHRYVDIPLNVDEIKLKELMEAGSVLSSWGSENEWCVLTVPPRIGLEKCHT